MINHVDHGVVLPKITRATTEVGRRYFTPEGKQWCGDRHHSKTGMIFSGKERNLYGSGSDGRSELLNTVSKKLGGPEDLAYDGLYHVCDDQFLNDGYKSYSCTVGGCMLIPVWWPQGQYTGPNALNNCLLQCKSWRCGEYSFPFAWLTFEFCFCKEVVGTGYTGTYPTQALCLAATQTKPCCTVDENTYSCTLTGCEIHTGPGVGTYTNTPYALHECEQDCVSWGCFDVYGTSAQTTTG